MIFEAVKIRLSIRLVHHGISIGAIIVVLLFYGPNSYLQRFLKTRAHISHSNACGARASVLSKLLNSDLIVSKCLMQAVNCGIVFLMLRYVLECRLFCFIYLRNEFGLLMDGSHTK